MADYISRDKINEAFDSIWDCADMVFEPDDHCYAADDCGHCKWLQTKNAIKKKLDNIQPADVRPVVRGHYVGEYDGYADGNPVYDMWYCSECGCFFEDWDEKPTYNFCPNCGADMREVTPDG